MDNAHSSSVRLFNLTIPMRIKIIFEQVTNEQFYETTFAEC